MPQPQKNDQSQARSSQPSISSSTQDTKQEPKNEAASALKEGLTSGARELSTEVKHVAGDLAGEARHAAEDKLRDGKNFAGEQLGNVAWALRNTSDALRSKESGMTEYVDRAARTIDDVSIYLSSRTISGLINDVEGYARREPAIFLGGAFFLGLLGGRFMKAAKPSPQMNAGTPGQPRAGASEATTGTASRTATAGQPKSGNGAAGNGATGNGARPSNGSTDKGPGAR